MSNHLHTSCHTAWVALGANLGERDRTLYSAIEALNRIAGTCVVSTSSFHETKAISLGGADAEAQPDYLNAAVGLTTELAPRAMLDALQNIERAHGRVRSASDRWASRTLDLDLLLYGQMVIDEPRLCVPHPRMAERMFVLAPLVEIAPDVVFPPTGQTIADLFEMLTAATNPSP